jgi:hypothetical protein
MALRIMAWEGQCWRAATYTSKASGSCPASSLEQAVEWLQPPLLLLLLTWLWPCAPAGPSHDHDDDDDEARPTSRGAAGGRASASGGSTQPMPDGRGGEREGQNEGEAG